MKLVTAIAAAAALLVAAPAADAATVYVPWTGLPVFSFATTIEFDPIVSSSFEAALGPATFGHVAGAGQHGALEVRVNGSYRRIASTPDVLSGDPAILLSEAFGSASFPRGVVDRIRLLSENSTGSSFGVDIGSCLTLGGCFRHVRDEFFGFGFEPAVSVPWSGSDIVSGSATISFDPFYSDHLVGVGGSGLHRQVPGGSQTLMLEVRVDGVFKRIATTPGGGDGINELSRDWADIRFEAGVVDQIRISRVDGSGTIIGDTPDVCDFVEGCFRNLTSLSFLFDPVPTPGTSALLAGAVTALGVLRRAQGDRRSAG